MTVKVSLEELVKTGAHFGHQSKCWNPKMAEYLYGEKDGIHIFDLTKTKALLEEALGVLKLASKEGKAILFIGTKKQVKDKIKEVALGAGSFYVNERWLGGILTNFDQIKRSLKKLEDLKRGLEDGTFKDRTKKEKLLIEREIERLKRFFGGLIGLNNLPDILVIIDIKREKTAVREANFKGVEIIALVDSNCDPTPIDYPIPMNDDASKALEYVLELMKEAILEGKKSDKRKVKSDKRVNI